MKRMKKLLAILAGILMLVGVTVVQASPDDVTMDVVEHSDHDAQGHDIDLPDSKDIDKDDDDHDGDRDDDADDKDDDDHDGDRDDDDDKDDDRDDDKDDVDDNDTDSDSSDS